MFELVNCKVLTKKQIYFECPFCFTNKNRKVFNTDKFKNGKQSTGRKPTLHFHGNADGTFENRLERRSSHCQYFKGDFCISINDNTIKEINN